MGNGRTTSNNGLHQAAEKPAKKLAKKKGS